MNRKLDTVFSELYQKHASYIYGVCLRYARNKEDAEDIMQEGFVNIYKGLEDFREDAKIKTWMVRIIINTTIRYYRKRDVFVFSSEENESSGYIYNKSLPSNTIEQLSVNELLEVLNEMPNGYRVVFNLYCIEGYKHREIAEMLGVSESTSKSQLTKAKAYAQKLIKTKLDIHY